LIEQAIYDLGRELTNQSTQIKIPLRRILHLLAIDPDDGLPKPEVLTNAQA
jgi:maltose alpha-D-glucosyltransferase/alpha-amylase